MAKINKTYQPGDEFTPDSVNEIIAAINSMVDAIYPVGSIYMSINDVNPSTLFGGKWEKIKDKFLLSSGDEYALGSKGGHAKHNHELGNLIACEYHSDGFIDYEYNSGGYDYLSYNANYRSIIPNSTEEQQTNSRSTGTNIRGIPTKEQDNMPPYLVVNIWKRIA